MSELFSKSNSFKDEYCCSICKVGQLTEIEGSDFLAKTIVNGTQIVVRKDQVHENDIMFYAENETALNEKFLSSNNLFELSCRNKNSNANEVNSIMDEYDEKYRNHADELRVKAKNIKSTIDSLTKSSKKGDKEIKKLTSQLETCSEGERSSIEEKIKEKRDKTESQLAKALSKTTEYTNLKNEIKELVDAGAPIVDKAKKMCGFFNKYGRVRCITLKGEASFGFLFGVDEMARFAPEVKNINLEDYIGVDFDTVNGELFVKAYVPPVKPENKRSSKENKRNKKLNRFDRIIDGEFKFHYDTNPLQKHIHIFKPDDVVTCNLKCHGTSIVIGKLHVREPKHILPHKWIWNKFVDITGLFKSTRFIDYDITYGPVYSSRTVIKNKYINNEVNSGYYSSDIWSEWGDKIFPYLDEGMTIYGEIFGYETGKDRMIQKLYDYGCEIGKNKLMIYRITTTNDDGSKKEWNVTDVYEWTKELINRMNANFDKTCLDIHPIDILYHGTLGDLYPEIDTNNHWHENVLEAMKKDKIHFGMEENEPLCTHHEVPREGICIRKDDDIIPSCFKLKTIAFNIGEAIRMDSGEIDIEMMDNYVNSEENDIERR